MPPASCGIVESPSAFSSLSNWQFVPSKEPVVAKLRRIPEFFRLENARSLAMKYSPLRQGWQRNLASASCVIRAICSQSIRLPNSSVGLIKAATEELSDAMHSFDNYAFQYDAALARFRRGEHVLPELPTSLVSRLSATMKQIEQAMDHVQAIVCWLLENSSKDVAPSSVKPAPQEYSGGYHWYEDIIDAYKLEYGTECPLLRSRLLSLLKRQARKMSSTYGSSFPSFSIGSDSVSGVRLAHCLEYAVDILGGPRW
eukprot:CAMPEP_0184657808 /NCGR_PEP_ID=MMETSP0308-20130426/21822_1 /TAXON_ID=38269 /ORGANISM="Gloeochaete witrockiana, Strain SAG 46.84" /LENGTH=255 /DNA_ID=CAMNT_0027096097 /DNA_START=69 /DNA_END=833 /DNA_ORIENTATION=-